MALYSYVAITPKGKTVKGNLEAESYSEGIEKIKAIGNTVVSLKEAGVMSRDIQISFLQAKPKPRDMAVFCRQFVSILEAGVPVISALEMLGEQTENKVLSKTIFDCKNSIETGQTLAQAMSNHPNIFSSMFLTMVEVGEASGSLETSFSRMAIQFEKSSKLKATIKKASIYPIVICVVAIFAISLLLTLVIPTFESMLKDLGTELPGITKFVISSSKIVKSSWYIIIAIIVGVVFLIRWFKKTDIGMHFFGRISIRLSLTKNLTVKTASAKFARTFSTLLHGGLPLLESLEICSKTMDNIYFREALEKAKEAVSAGQPLSQELLRSNVFPPLVCHMLKIGEETGSIESMLDKLSDYYDEEVESATERLMVLLEPIIILVLAVIVGTIVISVILPMASMYQGLDNL